MNLKFPKSSLGSLSKVLKSRAIPKLLYMGKTRSQLAGAINSANKDLKNHFSAQLQKRYFPIGRVK